MDWFFDQWLYKMGHPVFDITQAYDDAKKQLTLVAKQTQKVDLANEYPQTEFFQSYLEVEIDNKIERVWLESKEVNVFTFNVAAKPKLVNFDYEGTLLKEMKFEKSTDDLLYQLANDKDPIGRSWAMAELEKRADTDKLRVVAAVISSAEKDPFWRVRRAALSVIANIYSPDPPPGQARPAAKLDANVEAAVIRLTKDPQSLIRADAIELLGETQDKKFAQYALPMLEDRSYTVIDEASLALARMKEPRAFEPLLKMAATTSWRGRIQIAAYTALAELGDKRAFDNAYTASANKKLPIEVRTAALSVVGATGKGDPRAFPLVFEKFKNAVPTNNFGPISSGVQAIIKLADPRGQQAFDLLKEHFKGQQYPLEVINRWETEFKEAIKK
jgi:aminopeptidase N